MKIRRNIFLFKLNCLFGDLWPLAALGVVYFQQITGSYATAMGIFALINITQSLTEVPTGIFSDKLGRRKTMIISSVLFFIAFLLIALAGNIIGTPLLIAAAIVWGLGESFISGTEDALIYETMQELRKEDKYDIIYARSKTFAQIGLALGAVIATGVTYFYSLNILAWVSAILSVAMIFTSCLLIEPTIHIREEATSFKHFINAAKQIAKNKKLQFIALLQVLQRGVGMSSHRMEGAYYNMLVPLWLVNVSRIIKQTCGAISFHIAPVVRKFGFYKMLIASSFGIIFIKFISLILNNFITPFLSPFVNLFYGTASTAESALLQKELSSQQRATMGSIVSLVGAFVGGIVYYIAGSIADITSPYWAIVILLGANFMIMFGYYKLLKKYK